jgi:rRNA-processing protein FCF1
VFLKVRDKDIRGPTTLPVVARWVRFGGNIEAIPEFVIERLRKLEEKNELVREIKYVNPYLRGVRVVVHFPVQDVQSVVVRLAGNNRVLVETPMGRALVPMHSCKVL